MIGLDFALRRPCFGQADASGSADLASHAFHGAANAVADGESVLGSHASAETSLTDMMNSTGTMEGPAGAGRTP